MPQLSKIIGLSRKEAPQSDQPDTSRRAGFVEERLSPGRRIDFTRHLAFSLDEQRIRMVAVQRFGSKHRILGAENVAVPEQLQESADRQPFLADQVRAMYKRWKGRRSPRVSVVLSGRETAFRSFLMPRMKRKDLDRAVEFEARKQLPFPAEHCQLGYRVSSRLHRDDGPDRLRVALHAATAEHVAMQLGPFRKAGIDVHEVCHTPDLIGLLLGELTRQPNDSQGCTVIDVEQRSCRISFYRGAALEFSLSTSPGANPMEAEVDEIRLEAFADSLIQEIQTSQDYYLGQFGQGLSNTVYLCGDTETIERLCELLEGRSNLHFAPFPVARLPIASPPESEPRHWLGMLPLVGAAGSSYSGVNLLPPRYRKELATKRQVEWVRAAAVLFGLVLLVGWGTFDYRSDLIAREADASERRLARLQDSQAYRTYHALKRQITADQAYLQIARKVPTSFNLALKDLSRIVPGSVTLTSLQFLPAEPEHSLSVAGRVESDNVPPEIILAEFIADLNASPFFDDVTILRHTKDRTDNGFVMEFSLGMQGVVL